MAEFAGQWGPEGIDYPNGQHAVNTPFEVRTAGGILVPLFSNKERSVSKPNPGLTDTLGNLYFFANPGSYNLKIGGSFTIPISVQLHPDETISSGGGGNGVEQAVNNPTNLVQVLHGLGFKPAGILSLDAIGTQIEHDRVTFPEPGITEIHYGASFGPGVVYLS